MKLKSQTGKAAPELGLEDKSGKKYTLKSLEDKYIVLYFYPKDNTPGCTIETKAFNKALSKFEDLDAAVIGISGGDAKSKEKFCSKHRLTLPLLCDTDFKVSKAYGAYGEKSFMGRKFNGIFRNTYVLDESRRIIKVFEKVNPLSHSGEVLEYLKQLRSEGAAKFADNKPRRALSSGKTK